MTEKENITIESGSGLDGNVKPVEISIKNNLTN